MLNSDGAQKQQPSLVDSSSSEEEGSKPPSTTTTLLDEQFKMITEFTPSPYQYLSAEKEFNVCKNRTSKVSPLERCNSCLPHTLSSSIQVTGSLLERNGISPQILLFQPGLWVKVCCVYYCTLVLNLFFLLESNDDVIVTSTEGCCVLYFNLVFE